MTALEQMGKQIAEGGDALLSESARKRIGVHLLDTIGAWIAGSATEEGQMLAGLASSTRQALSVFGRHPLDQIALAVANTRLTEIDDIHMTSCTTPSSVVVPTALVVAHQLQHRDARNFAHAMNAGYVVMTRFGVAVAGPSLLRRGIWPTYLAAPLCAAAVTARLLGLTADKTANALGIALTMTSGAPGRPSGVSPRWLLLGMAARAGCTAALAAAEGYAGDRKLLDDDWMGRTHGIACDARAPVPKADGSETAVAALSLKPYCAAKQTIAAIDAFRGLLEKRISPDDMIAVRVAVPPAYAEMIGHRKATASRVARITSAAYQLALAAHRPEELENIARPNLADDPQIAAFMDRVEVVGDAALEEYYPQRWPARVEVLLRNGRTETEFVLDATGDPRSSYEFDVRAKFHRLADPSVGSVAADEIADACLAATESNEALSILCARMIS